MPVIYARVSDETLEFVKRQHDESGLPMARIVEAVLNEARVRGWTFRPPMVTPDTLPRVVEPPVIGQPR